MSKTTRREFISKTAKFSLLSLGLPFIHCKNEAPTGVSYDKTLPGIPAKRESLRITGSSRSRILLKNGLILDGTGEKAYHGDLLINGNKIEEVTGKDIPFSGKTIDCAGKAISPGFIDAHSHMDWIFPNKNDALKIPFTEQGMTTAITGHCGFGIAGFRKASKHIDLVEAGLGNLCKVEWRTFKEYYAHIKKTGLSHNMAALAGYGTIRTSMRGYDPKPLNKDEQKEIHDLITQALEQGARGVSFGLQYEPGIFATLHEIKEVAKIVKKHNKILTVHMKAYSSLSGTYPLEFFGTPHNILAIQEMIQITRETGVRMQLSHLIFVGESSWDTYDEAIELIDAARAEGLDIKFDTYAYHCGQSIINVIMPEWFLAGMPGIFNDRSALNKLKMEFTVIETLLGFGYGDIQVTDALVPELKQYDGLFLSEIAKKRGLDEFINYIDFVKRTNGKAEVLNHKYSNLNLVKSMIMHPAALFMTDALPAAAGVQNPAVTGNFPRFLQLVRENKLIRLEEAIYKMTGATAERYQIKDRGFLKKGYAADITVFDYKNIKDNNTQLKTSRKPDGIEAVFINGNQMIDKDITSKRNDYGVIV
ncbi:MAG: amidohydrolase family protein [bacterium]|nr:amidohydrolase family protein [bacterium]